MKKEKVKQVLLIIALLALTITFFSYNVVICVDSSHYCWLTSLLESRELFSYWDVARGIVFPGIIYILNKVFGQNLVSLQTGMYIAYAIMLVICYCIYKHMNKEYQFSKPLKVCLLILFLLAVVINPLIFGYYHVLLTEFVAMTACIVASYFAWKWIEVKFTENKFKYIAYTIYFAVSMAFMWHLKQPYMFTILIPFVISMILSVIKEFKWKNILQRVISLCVCMITLVVSIKVWDVCLEKFSVSINKNRTSSSMLSNQLLAGMSEYFVISDEQQYTKESIEQNPKISNEDKENILSILNEENEEYQNFLLVECAPYRELDKSQEIKVIYIKGENLSLGESLGFLASTFIEDPMSIIKGYVNDYLTTISFYRATTVGVNGVVTKEISLSGTYENAYIAYNIYRATSNDLTNPEFYSEYIGNYIGMNRPIKIVNMFLSDITQLTVYTFKAVLLAVPVLFIASFILFIILRVKKKEAKKIRIYELLTILYGYSFLNVLMYSMLGGLIDRYAISSYLAVNIGLLIHFAYIVSVIRDIIKTRKNKQNEKQENTQEKETTIEKETEKEKQSEEKKEENKIVGEKL